MGCGVYKGGLEKSGVNQTDPKFLNFIIVKRKFIYVSYTYMPGSESSRIARSFPRMTDMQTQVDMCTCARSFHQVVDSL